MITVSLIVSKENVCMNWKWWNWETKMSVERGGGRGWSLKWWIPKKEKKRKKKEGIEKF